MFHDDDGIRGVALRCLLADAKGTEKGFNNGVTESLGDNVVKARASTIESHNTKLTLQTSSLSWTFVSSGNCSANRCGVELTLAINPKGLS
jgi:hypothetical protein